MLIRHHNLDICSIRLTRLEEIFFFRVHQVATRRVYGCSVGISRG